MSNNNLPDGCTDEDIEYSLGTDFGDSYCPHCHNELNDDEIEREWCNYCEKGLNDES